MPTRTERLFQYARQDWSAASLMASNILTLVMALAGNWNAGTLMWVYWGQSVIIGFFNFLRMLFLKDFSTEGVKASDQPVDPTPATRRSMAFFFLIHYGGFHLVYMVFLVGLAAKGLVNLEGMGICLAAFLVNHAFSFFYNLQSDRRNVRNIGTLMFFPYARILPMHLTIIFGSLLPWNRGVLLLFLSLKTAADLIMHAVEHAALGENPNS
ncbi:MAG TPA: DUF6498-containing protein [Kiritimatiellia bacterium]|nr:DUF6498-containing protein [Kiritimatiellia bacterium]HSA19126.1 DUF6498-containing protein [Kiritimatiellia bacterium]